MCSLDQEQPDSERSLGDLCECGHTRAAHALCTDCDGQRDGLCLAPCQPRCSAFRKAGEVKPDEKPIEHPGDVCQCGHMRAQHGDVGNSKTGCMIREDADGFEDYADECVGFMLAKTALEVAIDTAEDANANDELEECADCGHLWTPHTLGEGGCAVRSCECPAGARVPAPVLPPRTDQPMPLYTVTCAVEGGQTYEIDVPGDFSVMAVDGILKIWTPRRAVLAITAVRQYPTLTSPED